MVKTLGYVGRGLAIGLSDDEQSYYQVFWLMDRSENSRNRVITMNKTSGTIGFFLSGFNVRPYKGKVENPELHLYTAMEDFYDKHVISNGKHTLTLVKHITNDILLENALKEIDFEPDEPNYTPRIGGVLYVKDDRYQILISKTHRNNPNYPQKHLFTYEQPIPGLGHMITTYTGDGDPLPSFNGEPHLIPIENTLEQNFDHLMDLLNNEHLVSLAIKQIDRKTRDFKHKIYNKRLEE